jgi:GTP cyclohydrolase II
VLSMISSRAFARLYGFYNRCFTTRASLRVLVRALRVIIGINLPDLKLNKVAEADFPTRFGRFRVYGFEAIRPTETEEALALAAGNLSPELGPALVRIHSQCMTGDVFHSLRCDCRSQLELALDQIVQEERGLLIYEHQEGRGIGLLNKLRAYELQDRGLDTVEANEELGFDADLRDYALPAAILEYFHVSQVRLLSNNPAKVAALENAGIQVVERAPIVVPPLETTAEYLRAKREKLGHLI